MEARTKQAVLRLFRLTRALPQTFEAQTIRKQVVRSASSVGANYRAAQRSRSKAEFKAKLGIVEEEADETCFWLELVIEDEALPATKVEPLLQEFNEITAIVSASLRTIKAADKA
ncbi:MAG: four helix bundle protein [Planctomycetota bacterium]